MDSSLSFNPVLLFDAIVMMDPWSPALHKTHSSFTSLTDSLSCVIASAAAALQFASLLSQTAFVISLSSLCACVLENTANILLKLTMKQKRAKIEMINAGDHSCVFLRGRFEGSTSCWLFKTLLCECLFFYSLCLLLQILSVCLS